MKLLLGIVMAFAGLQAGTQVNSGAISGRVTSVGGLEPVPNVQILLVGPLSGTALNAAVSNPLMISEIAAGSSTPQINATTDSSGRFSFRDLAPGRYTIRAQRDGYFAAPSPGIVGTPTLATSMVAVVAGQPNPEAIISLIHGSTVSGRVRDPNGQPASSMSVSAFQLSYRDGRVILSNMVSKTTDDRGEYRIFWLPPGEYYIAATPPRPSTVVRPQDSWARTFFPGATEARTAPPLAVTEASELAGIDINLQAVASVKVSGRVINTIAGPNGQVGTAAANFLLLSRDPANLTDSTVPQFINSAQNRTSGQFELRGVPPGSYDLLVTAPDGQGRPFPSRTPIDVGSQDLDNVTVTIRPGVPVKAQIVFDGKLIPAPPPQAAPVPQAGTIIVNGGTTTVFNASPPQSPPTMRLQLRSKESYASPFDSAVSSNITSDPSGAFVFPSVPEALYTFQVSGIPANAYVADIREGGVSIYDSGLKVTDQPPAPIEVIVNSNGPAIKGTVVDSAQEPVASAMVVLVPQESRRQNTALYKLSRSGTDGSFTLTAVPPGEYKLFAWESVATSAYMNADFLAKYEARGRPVTVAAGAGLNVQLTVISAESRR
jgi:hypothetical protein